MEKLTGRRSRFPDKGGYTNIDGHIENLRLNIELMDDGDVAILLLTTGIEFSDVMKDLLRLYKKTTGSNLEVDLAFSIDDEAFGVTQDEKIMMLRRLKALKEYPPRGLKIKSIKVKGPEGTPSLQPNVFASGIMFEAFD